jgi:predicted glycoside hydrolase/deacetylase ChbG (UPF0249 family)
MQLIVNADDFGRCAGINAGVATAHREGVVTSASLMVLWPAALQAARYAHRNPDLSLGLHIDLEEWVCDPEHGWSLVYRVVDGDDAIEGEIRRQLELFRRLVGRDPTHLDSHQHVHCKEPARTVVWDLAAELGVPARRVAGEVAYRGGFYGRNLDGSAMHHLLSTQHLISMIWSLGPGFTEVSCHPAAHAQMPTPAYSVERRLELATLCDPRVAAAIAAEGIELASFRDVPAPRPSMADAIV